MSDTKQSCECNAAPTLIFACSGGADIGEVADRAARSLAAAGAGKMFCLAGIGGRIESFIAATGGAGKILAIDGCPMDCARKTLESAGIADFQHLRATDLGLMKGQAPATPETIERVARRGQELLAATQGECTGDRP